MNTETIVLLLCLGCSCFASLGGLGLVAYFFSAIKAWFSSLFSFPSLSSLDAFSCKNPPCKEGEGCLQGAGKCAVGLFCNASSKCEKKRANGAYCAGVAAGDYCQSGKCGTLSTCLTSDGKVVIGESCSVVDQCDQNDKVNGPLWCGGVPIKCRKLGEIGDYCPLDSSKCKSGLYCDSTSKCASPRDDGAGCFTDSACKSGKCGKSNTCLTKDGHMANWVGVCGSDSDCAPGNKCSSWGGRGAQCQPLGGVGDNCTYSSGCKAGLYCASDSKCTVPREIGAGCFIDAGCASGNCTGNICRAKPGSSGIGQACTAHNECSTNACARATAADNTSTTCCPSGKYDYYGGYAYCYNMPAGSTCWSDAMCASGSCSGNWNGLRRGTC